MDDFDKNFQLLVKHGYIIPVGKDKDGEIKYKLDPVKLKLREDYEYLEKYLPNTIEKNKVNQIQEIINRSEISIEEIKYLIDNDNTLRTEIKKIYLEKFKVEIKNKNNSDSNYITLVTPTGSFELLILNKNNFIQQVGEKKQITFIVTRKNDPNIREIICSMDNNGNKILLAFTNDKYLEEYLKFQKKEHNNFEELGNKIELVDHDLKDFFCRNPNAEIMLDPPKEMYLRFIQSVNKLMKKQLGIN